VRGGNAWPPRLNLDQARDFAMRGEEISSMPSKKMKQFEKLHTSTGRKQLAGQWDGAARDSSGGPFPPLQRLLDDP
jgi:hypothetical protein